MPVSTRRGGFKRSGRALPGWSLKIKHLILDAGGFKAYERAHLQALTKTLSPKLAHLLPPELVRKVVEHWIHAGCYVFTA